MHPLRRAVNSSGFGLHQRPEICLAIPANEQPCVLGITHVCKKDRHHVEAEHVCECEAVWSILDVPYVSGRATNNRRV